MVGKVTAQKPVDPVDEVCPQMERCRKDRRCGNMRKASRSAGLKPKVGVRRRVKWQPSCLTWCRKDTR